MIFVHSHEGGEINQTEYEILHRVVRVSDMTAREVMVPRVEMKALPVEMTVAEVQAYLHNRPHSRVPVFHESMDEIRGIVHLKDLVLFEASLRDPSLRDHERSGGTGDAVEMVDLTPLVREAPRVPETMTIDRLLLEFKRRRQQMAIVIDEYGGTSGLVTMGDLLEQVFGDVHDEFDRPQQEIVEQEDGQIVLVGRVLIDEVNDRYHLGFRSDDADTMAGLVLSALGRPAVVGDEVVINGARLRVTAIDRLRITQLLLRLPPADRES
jgi:CBS domain containing-hemolysin-like protein